MPGVFGVVVGRGDIRMNRKSPSYIEELQIMDGKMADNPAQGTARLTVR